MDGMVGSKSSLTWIVNISVVLLVALWLFHCGFAGVVFPDGGPDQQ